MFLRISSAAVLLTLAGCGSTPVVEDKVAAAKPDDRIECALGGRAEFARDCAVERGDSVLTLRHRDGGFRRLTLDAGGSIDAADGADRISSQVLRDGRSEIAVGRDRYRLPADL